MIGPCDWLLQEDITLLHKISWTFHETSQSNMANVLWGFLISTTYWHYLFFFRKQVLTFDTSCKLSPFETVCMKCQNLFSGKNKKNVCWNVYSACWALIHHHKVAKWRSAVRDPFPLRCQTQQLSSGLSSAGCFKSHCCNSVDPDQTAPLGTVWSGSTLFGYMQNVCLKSLQEDAADNINRWHFQMQVFLTF